MPVRLSTRDADFGARFEAFLAAKREAAQDVEDGVRAIIADVAARGDAALVELTQRYDKVDLSPIGLRVAQPEIDRAYDRVDRDTRAALELAWRRIEAHHLRQLPKDDYYADPIGVEIGQRWNPIESVGMYVPGGTAAYPSTVLMNAIPARVAGVGRIAMTVPAPGGELNPLVLAAAKLAGIDEIYRIGGAQAVAALAFGTETVKAVAKIVGPGNAYVAAAKRLVFGRVGIDMVAGPSEVLVLADGGANPDWIAADLLAQAEHDEAAQPILVTDSTRMADSVEQSVQRQLQSLPRAEIAGASWREFGAIILVRELREAMPLIDRIAPEHLQILAADAERLANRVTNAGAIFLGEHTPEAVGDYVGGTNHVLPTARAARYASGLGVQDFMKRTAILKCGPDQLRKIGPAAVALAKAERLEAHARSVQMRLESD